MNMFRRGSTVPQRKPFSLMGSQILEDISAISNDEELRNKLYYCLDEKPPQDHKFAKIEDFLKGSQDLEDLSDKLNCVTNELVVLKKEVADNLNVLKSKVEKSVGQSQT